MSLRDLFPDVLDNHDILLAIIVLLNGIFVLSGLPIRSLWLDEAWTLQLARLTDLNDFFSIFAEDVHPPFYHAVLLVWTKVFGISEFALRFPSYIFGLGVIFLVFYWSKKRFNKQVASISSFLVAINPIVIKYQQEARMYTLLPFLLLLVYILLDEWKDHNYRLHEGLGIVFTSTLALYTHNYALIGLFGIFLVRIVIALFFLPKKSFESHILAKYGLILIAIGLIYLPWVSILLNQASRPTIGGAIQTVTLTPLIQFVLIAISLSNFFEISFSAIDLVQGVLFLVPLFAIIGSLILTFRNRIRLTNEEILALATFSLALIYFGIPFGVSYIKFPLGYSIYNLQYVIFSIIVLKIYIAYALVQISIEGYNFLQYYSVEREKNKLLMKINNSYDWLRLIVSSLLIILVALSSVMYIYGSTRFYRSWGDYRGASVFIEQNSDKLVPVIYEGNIIVFQYYFDPSWHPYLVQIRPNSRINETIYSILADNNSDSFWYCRYVPTYEQGIEYYAFDWATVHGFIDQNIGMVDFSGLELFKCTIKIR
ncbi:MAG: glycosyltransferase family 39 protein [Candidatus Hodarchaeota archaeon]